MLESLHFGPALSFSHRGLNRLDSLCALKPIILLLKELLRLLIRARQGGLLSRREWWRGNEIMLLWLRLLFLLFGQVFFNFVTQKIRSVLHKWL